MMDDEALLHELGRYVRANDRGPEVSRLERLSAGALSADERAELNAAAERDPALANAVQAYAPLSADARARIAQRVAAIAKQGAQSDASDGERPATVVTKLPARRGRLFLFGAPLAAAASVLLWIASSGAPVAPLPEYALQVAGAPAELRGPAVQNISGPIAITASTRLQLTLRPASAAGADVSARVFLIAGNAAPIAWPAEVTAAETGALRIVLATAPSDWQGPAEARIIVARAALLASDSEALASGDEARGQGFQRFSVKLER